MQTDRKLIVYISMTLDGYIATKDDSLDFLNAMEQAGEDYGYGEFIQSVDSIIIGRKTYQKVLDMGYDYPHTDKAVYIITRTERPAIGSFQFYTASIPKLVAQLKSKAGKNIYCDGGASIVHELQKDDLIDEYIISVIPVLLGDGIPLFKAGQPEQLLKLESTKSFEKGLVQLHYSRVRN